MYTWKKGENTDLPMVEGRQSMMREARAPIRRSGGRGSGLFASECPHEDSARSVSPHGWGQNSWIVTLAVTALSLHADSRLPLHPSPGPHLHPALDLHRAWIVSPFLWIDPLFPGTELKAHSDLQTRLLIGVVLLVVICHHETWTLSVLDNNTESSCRHLQTDISSCHLQRKLNTAK